jgi:hypothetical protein
MEVYSYGGECARECGIMLAANLKIGSPPEPMNAQGSWNFRQARRKAAGFNGCCNSFWQVGDLGQINTYRNMVLHKLAKRRLIFLWT